MGHAAGQWMRRRCPGTMIQALRTVVLHRWHQRTLFRRGIGGRSSTKGSLRLEQWSPTSVRYMVIVWTNPTLKKTRYYCCSFRFRIKVYLASQYLLEIGTTHVLFALIQLLMVNLYRWIRLLSLRMLLNTSSICMSKRKESKLRFWISNLGSSKTQPMNLITTCLFSSGPRRTEQTSFLILPLQEIPQLN